jgi:hypothetical protein
MKTPSANDHRKLKFSRLARMGLLGLLGVIGAHRDESQAADLSKGFQNPPEETKPYCYWYWVNSDITADGITKDIEAMAKVGIRRAMIGNIEGGGPVKMMSPEWTALTRHAMKEAARLKVELMMFNAPGWSQSGGPWIKPEQSMRRVTWNEIPAQGGKFSQVVRPAAGKGIQDIAVLAVPKKAAVSIPGAKSADNILGFRHSAPFKARALVVNGRVDAKLFAVNDGKRELVAAIQTGLPPNPDTDFLPDGVETFSFKEVTAQEFVLEPCALEGGKVTLTSEPKVAQVIEKQMGRMHPTPSPQWESYIFPDTMEPDDASTVLKQQDILDLTTKLDAKGVLTCELPAGEWTVIYFGMVTTGKQNRPAPPEATGLEVDKMSKSLIEYHFNSMFGGLFKEMTPAEKSAFKGVTIDSYEVGAQNWTDGFDKEFKKRAGYDPIRLLPVFTGRVVDSAKSSDQFLWDLRRTVADMIAENYVGGLRDIAHKHGMTIWCENYGHWGFPGEFLNYGRYSDEVGGEFWFGNDLGAIECRAASSSAHIYGKRRVYAEAFTSTLDQGRHPYIFKARGEEMFCEGINHFVLHVMTHQPRDGTPGKNAWFGTPFHRNTPWFNEGRDWVKYLQRCHYMLQQGEPVADVAVYIGDFAPQMSGPPKPVPVGYDYDYMGSDAILSSLKVVNGEWVVCDEKNPNRIGARYKLLALPKSGYTRPKVLARLEQLKKAGGKTIEAVPVPAETMQSMGITPIVSESTCAVRWKARRLDDGMLFFLSNFAKSGQFEATLRVSGKVPELYNPVTGKITKIVRYKEDKNGTRICINVNDPADSFFVLFRDKASAPSVVKVEAEGKNVPPAELDLYQDPRGGLTGESAKQGTYSLTLSDGTTKSLVVAADARSLAIPGPWTTTPKNPNGFSVLQETTFTVPAGFGKGQKVYLDLGTVQVMAKVTLNGKSFDTLWMPPFVLDVSNALQPGSNKLQVLVTSTSQGKPALGEKVQLRATSIGGINP